MREQVDLKSRRDDMRTSVSGKYSDEQLDLFLDMMNVKLLSYQREMFKKLANTDMVYIVMPPRVGFGEYAYLREMLSIILGERKER